MTRYEGNFMTMFNYSDGVTEWNLRNRCVMKACDQLSWPMRSAVSQTVRSRKSTSEQIQSGPAGCVTGALQASWVNTGAGSPSRNDSRGAVCTIHFVSFVQCWEIIFNKNDWSTETWCPNFQQKPNMLLWPICSGYQEEALIAVRLLFNSSADLGS